jgi:hypothetical protein
MTLQSRATTSAFFLLATALVATPRPGHAKVAADTSPLSNRVTSPINAWASAGLGPGEMQANNNGVIAGLLRGTVSVGPWLASYRVTDISPFLSSGNGIIDNAFLVGLRSDGRRLFASAEVGYSHTNPYYSASMDAGGRRSFQGSQSAMAFDLGLHATVDLAGVSLALSGAVGPARSTYAMTSLSVELGWFGP